MRTLEVTISGPTFLVLEWVARIRSEPVENVVMIALDAYLQPAPDPYVAAQHSNATSYGAQRRALGQLKCY